MFGDTVRRHRQRLGLSQEALADAAAIAVRSVRNMEAGRVAQPRPTTLRLLAGVFGISVDELTAGGPAPVPAQLPREVSAFAGRADILDRLWTLLDHSPGAVGVISGAGGVGKTTLAVHWAHQAAGRFPDGQLYVNLHGFGPGDSAIDPTDVLADFLTALGVDRTAVPPTLASRTALFRSRLAGRRALIVLDNARDAEQVRPLLPGAGVCRVVVTSRNQLTALIATDGAVPVPLEVLAAARRGTDPLVLAYALSDMAGALMGLGRYAETVSNSEEARRLLHDRGDAAGERIMLGNLQEIYTVIGNLTEAQRCAAEQLAIVRALGQPIAVGESSVQLAHLNLHLGRLDEALAYAEEAVRIFEPTDRTRDRGESLWALGAVHQRRGEHHEARVTLLRAQEVFRSAGMYGNLLARVLAALGRLSREQGQRQAAGRYLGEALDLAREFNDPEQVAEALTELGLLRADQGRPEEAAAHVREALALATQVGTRREEIRARNALGALLAAVGDTGPARREFSAALELATATENPYARGLAEEGLARLDGVARDGVA